MYKGWYIRGVTMISSLISVWISEISLFTLGLLFESLLLLLSQYFENCALWPSSGEYADLGNLPGILN